MPNPKGQAIAVIGMAGRFPDAKDVRAFWRNLMAGHESLIAFSEEELVQSGTPRELIHHPQFVPKGTILQDSDLFDAAFFGFSPREAEILDPQHRVLLECAWQAMEDGGYAGGGSENVGIYAGGAINTYLLFNLLTNPKVTESAGAYQVMISSDKDFLATRIAYKLGLRGPAVTVQTACSTSLVAVHMACRALLGYECDMALAGGVALHFPQKTGYFYQEGMIFSPDGHCRPFDADGQGIRGGEGAGLVLLKRLDEAVRDGDTIRAVILGTAVKNDGADKMGYTAPSIDGQAETLSAALATAEVDASSIRYIEAHGTATALGDAIEFEALSKVYGGSGSPCALGALKSNIGHLDTAAGVAGLIKAVLTLQHRRIPPTLHFRCPNPRLHWGGSRFYVNAETQDWPPAEGPRRAAVSSFGIGGTNAHAVLEEAPGPAPSRTLWPSQLLVISAVTPQALDAAAAQLADHLEANPEVALSDLCYTMQVGRKRLAHRRAVECLSASDLRGALKKGTPKGPGTAQNSVHRSAAFLFSGQGSQYAGMGRELYGFQPTFRRQFDRCAELLIEPLGLDLRDLIYESQAVEELHETRLAQPALFALEYSLAQMWMRFGVTPVSMIGHSLGEITAACVAGVFSLEDALQIAAFRGNVMQNAPRGSMLAVGIAESALEKLVAEPVCIAAVNGRSSCTVSGPPEAIANLQRDLERQSIPCTKLQTSHAFHSASMDSAADEFRSFVSRFSLRPPEIPYVSNVTGRWITPEEATDPGYWARHLRRPVRFQHGLREIATPDATLLEIGPGQALAAFARELQSPDDVFASLPRAKDPQSAAQTVLKALGGLWQKGIDVDWNAVHEGESLHRIPLPTYPFERKRFYVAPGQVRFEDPATPAPERAALNDWFYRPSWRRSNASELKEGEDAPAPWLVFADAAGVADSFIGALEARSEPFIRVTAGGSFALGPGGVYTIDPGSMEQYRDLLADLMRKRMAPRYILFAWSLRAPGDSFYHLLRLAQAFGEVGACQPVELLVLSSGLYKVHGDEPVDPDNALLLGPCKIIPAEYPNIQCRNIDLNPDDDRARLSSLLRQEPLRPRTVHGIAYRKGYRWEQYFESAKLPPASDRIRPGGVYLITGGLGGIGLTLARYFASFQARIALTGRSATPPREEWDAWLESHPEEDAVSERIRQMRDLEKRGATVLPLVANVSDFDQMRTAIETIHQRFGPIEGIVHAAGVADGGLIQLKTIEAAERVLAPKVEGTRILHTLTREEPLKFMVLCSSVNALVGVPGAVAYTSANAFLDAYATTREEGDGPAVTSIAWDAWQEVGMAVNTPVPREMRAARLASLHNAIRPEEGVEAFRRVLAARLPQIAVLTSDKLTPPPPTTESITQWSSPKQVESQDEPSDDVNEDGASGRSLNTPFEAPQTEVEQTIARIWRDALGQTRIGLDDNFFDLGGHSLVGTSILSQIRAAFQVNLPLRLIFEAPTVRVLARHVETLSWNASAETAEEDREEIEI